VLAKWNIRSNLGYITADGALNNGTMLKELHTKLSGDRYRYEMVKRRLYCNGHIFNLVVKEFLFGSDPIRNDLEDADEKAV